VAVVTCTGAVDAVCAAAGMSIAGAAAAAGDADDGAAAVTTGEFEVPPPPLAPPPRFFAGTAGPGTDVASPLAASLIVVFVACTRVVKCPNDGGEAEPSAAGFRGLVADVLGPTTVQHSDGGERKRMRRGLNYTHVRFPCARASASLSCRPVL
jgi:hypothetical protein